jgi:hypothetical protein
MSSPFSDPSWTWCGRPWAVFAVLCKKLNCGLAISRERRDPSKESLPESIARPVVLCELIGHGSKHSLVNFDQCSQPRGLILTIGNVLPGRRGKIPSGIPHRQGQSGRQQDETEHEGRNQRQSAGGEGHNQRDRRPGHPQPQSDCARPK